MVEDEVGEESETSTETDALSDTEEDTEAENLLETMDAEEESIYTASDHCILVFSLFPRTVCARPCLIFMLLAVVFFLL